MIDSEIVRSIGLSVIFSGIILSLVSLGIIILGGTLRKRIKKELSMMAVLIILWSIFMILTVRFGMCGQRDIEIFFFKYTLMHLITTIFGTVIIIVWILSLKKSSKVFDKQLSIFAGVFAVLTIIARMSISYNIAGCVGSLFIRILTVVPPLIGLIMIIKAIIGKNEE
jgi:hypothetical protein